MARTKANNTSERLTLSVSSQTKEFLDELVKIGFHGSTAPAVAASLLQQQITEFIKDGFLEKGRNTLKKPND